MVVEGLSHTKCDPATLQIFGGSKPPPYNMREGAETLPYTLIGRAMLAPTYILRYVINTVPYKTRRVRRPRRTALNNPSQTPYKASLV